MKISKKLLEYIHEHNLEMILKLEKFLQKLFQKTTKEAETTRQK